MKEISVIGVDLAKRVFQLCALDASGEVVLTKRLGRQGFKSFMEHKAPRCRVGLEACAGAHHWGRWLVSLGFEVKLMAPRAVKPFVTGAHKNDSRDARAIAEACSRPFVGSVALKSPAALALQALIRVRDRRLRQKVQVVNQFRALLHEFGFVAPKGTGRLLKRYVEITQGEVFRALPVSIRELLEELYGECSHLIAQAEASKRALEKAAGQDPTCRLLMTTPHLGPVNAAGLTAAVGEPQAFANGRAFAAWIGIVPRQQASGEKSRMHGITKHGSRQLRTNLVLAAQSLITRALKDQEAGKPLDQLARLAIRLHAKKHRNVAATAIAARLARIAWAMMARNIPYQANLA